MADRAIALHVIQPTRCIRYPNRSPDDSAGRQTDGTARRGVVLVQQAAAAAAASRSALTVIYTETRLYTVLAPLCPLPGQFRDAGPSLCSGWCSLFIYSISSVSAACYLCFVPFLTTAIAKCSLFFFLLNSMNYSRFPLCDSLPFSWLFYR